MTRDFTLVRSVLAASLIGRSLAALDHRAASAWHTSTVKRAARWFRDRLRAQPAAKVIRSLAAAIVIATLVQFVLMNLVSRTVAPAMPWGVFVLVALFAAVIAWQADAIVQAWPASRLVRRLRR